MADSLTTVPEARPAQGTATLRSVVQNLPGVLRLHQWSKNLLILVPLFISQPIGPQDVLAAALAFLAFSLTASGGYILNDLVDLSADRNHRTKRLRPFASGAVPVALGLVLVPVLLAGAAAIALQLPRDFGFLLAVYFVATCAYSFRLKRMLMIDIVVLGCLYAMRVIAGGAAIDAVISEWLTAFSLFFFMCIALVKRFTELAGLDASINERARNRSYRTEDLPVLLSLAAASGFSAVTIFMRYIGSDEILKFYTYPDRLWFITPILIYWLARLLLLANRLKVPDDPVIFAMRDSKSILCGVMAAGLILWAA